MAHRSSLFFHSEVARAAGLPSYTGHCWKLSTLPAGCRAGYHIVACRQGAAAASRAAIASAPSMAVGTAIDSPVAWADPNSGLADCCLFL